MYLTLHKYGYHPFKIRPVQHLTADNIIQRHLFCEEILRPIRRLQGDDQLLDKVLWSDEATFTTAGMFNHRNKHFWAIQNPHKIEPVKKQGRKSLHVWCGILKNKIVGPVIFEGNLTGQRYLHFLTNEIEHLLEELPVREYTDIIWHQDGAPAHCIQPITNYLNNRYDLWIGRNGPIQWSANSPDLTPLDNFLWGYLKDKIYYDRTNNLLDLRQKIEQEIYILNNEHSFFTSNAVRKSEEIFQNCFRNGGSYV